MKEIDARGLACPAPVLHTKATLQEEKPAAVKVIVDNEASQQNVQRFLESQGFQTTLKQQGADYIVVGTCGSEPREHAQAATVPEVDAKKIMVLCATDRMGFGDDDLGLKLMVSFLRTLKEMGPDLWRVVCGTCLNHFKLLDRKQAGETTNMLDIVTAAQLADKMISL